jgi:hypothetical protein
MPFESFSHVPITEELLRHVWDGEDDLTQGGHRYGLGREGKTEFPEHWDIDVLRQSIRLTLDKPQAIRVKNPYISCDRVVAQVLIRVRLFRPQETVKVLAAYPLCGEGVVRNQLGRRINLPLDFSRLET